MPRKKKPPVWEQYVDDVLSGRVLAGKWVKLACKRHRDDMAEGHKRGLQFVPQYAQEAIDFFTHLKHSKGEHAGQVFVLSPWQAFVVASIFGWYKADNTRRFRFAHVAVARKNGKTTLLAGLGLYGLVADREEGAEIYAAATKEDQAKIVWEEAVAMRQRSPEVAEVVKKTQKALLVNDTRSTFKFLGSDSETLDGLNVHFGIVDELHAHPNRKLWDVLQTGTGARVQPLMFAITTAGYNQTCYCRTQQDMGEKILLGLIPFETGDSWFFYMAAIDKTDNWEDEANWIKANPNLNVSVKLEGLRQDALNAKAEPSALNEFLTKRLNVWTQQQNRFIPMDKWEKCVGSKEEKPNPFELRKAAIAALKGRRCFSGLDLAKSIDLSAYVLLFPPVPEKKDLQGKIVMPGDPHWILLPWFWCPEENIQSRSKNDRVPYDVWARNGYITATDGAVVDYSFIKAKIKELKNNYQLIEMGFDSWNAQQLCGELKAEGCPVVEVRMGVASLNEPTNFMLSRIMDGTLKHLDNPVMNWMADNFMVKKDVNGGVQPDKEKARERIDGIVATILAFQRVVANGGNKPQKPKIWFM